MRQRKSLMTPSTVQGGQGAARTLSAALAEIAGLGVSTVADFELERRAVSPEAAHRLQPTLEASGVQFTNGKHPGVRLAR